VSPDLSGKILGPVSAVHGVVFVPTDSSALFALDTRTGAQLWTFRAPDKSACGPSIVDGRVLWGYGFTLFSGAGKGGIMSFSLPGRS
jgi:polyvinyl alcohol dehydrogenase (cytochrome)